MPHSFFDDYDPCDTCGHDHQYDNEAATLKHKEILIRKERDKYMAEVNQSEELELKQDPQAYLYAAACIAIVLAFVVSLYWAW